MTFYPNIPRSRLLGVGRVLFVSFISLGGVVTAQIPPNATADDLTKLKADAELQQQVYQALKNASDAKQAYEATLDTAKQALADQSAAAKAAKDASDAKTAAANAQKAQSDAELAALKAKFGDFTGSGQTGAVEMGTGAGSAEAMLLGAASLNVIAARLATQINADADTKSIVLSAAANVPDMQALLAFNSQYAALNLAVLAARQIAPPDSLTQEAVTLEFPVAGVGLALDAVSKLLSFAKTDFKFASVEIAATDAMLVDSLAALLTSNGRAVYVPALYYPDAFAATNAVLTQMSESFKWSQEAKRNFKLFEAVQADYEKKLAAAPNDQALKDKLLKAKNGLSVWKTTSDAIDAWSKQISSADDKGNTPLATILRQSAFKVQLDGGAALVIVQLHKVSGSAYTEKNLWSSLGLTPFYVMGGAVAGYVAIDGPSGKILGSRLIPVHGGYHSVSKIQDLVNGAASK